MTQLSTRRLSIVLALALAMVAMVALPPTALGAPEDQPAAAESAAEWIAAELDRPEPSFDAFGATSARTDVLYALASTGGEEGAARRALSELADGAEDYIGPPDELNVGATAKVLLSVLINRHDPVGFVPGRDLEAELRASIDGDGSFADDVFSHALAMIALAATDHGVPTDAVGWLTDQQEADGSWPNPFSPDDADIDSTAVALQALLAAGEALSAADAAAFLVGVQNDDGSWPSAFGDPNANTAGVAGQALRAAGETAAADLAADFVISLQTEDGGIRFTAAEAEANGFATLQGVLALGGPAYHELDLSPFGDVDWDHLFANEVDWLGDSNVTRGCDPPDNNNFCPDDNVTRGQMAAFLHRALGDTLPTGDTTSFDDDNDSVFEADIEWLAATGVTKGCNPPANDLFCPEDNVTRGQMAAFLYRALQG